MPTRIQGSASGTLSRLSCQLTCGKRRPYPVRVRTNCRQVQQTARDYRLAERLTDHVLGRGARLTQVQLERGGFWVLAQTEPGGRLRERQLKQHGAARRCEVCKAVDGYKAGDLTAQQALARAGWHRSSQVQRSLLLDIFGLPQPPEPTPAQQPGAEHSAAPLHMLPQPQPARDPELDALVDGLIAGWASRAEAQREAEGELEAAP